MSTRKFWPWDFNSEGEIYENVRGIFPVIVPNRASGEALGLRKKPGISTGRKRTPA